MMNVPLTLRSMLERAEKFFPRKEIVSRTSSGIFRYTYAEYGRRTRRLSSALASLGVKRGERVATFAWNHHRHLEAYFAIPCMGAVLHTINIRLSPEHIIYIVNHAEDRVMLVDEDLVPILEKIQDQLPTIKAYVMMTDKPELPPTTLHPVYSYEQLIEQGDPAYTYPEDLDENAPLGMCYTSATTGNPKGVVYSHRGIFLHSMAVGLADTIGLSENDTIMPVVPMFHANAWGFPFAAVWFGAKQVLPGPGPTPKLLLQLIQQEKVTLAAGVPTVWLGVLKAMEEEQYDVKSLRSVICGGSAAPRSLIQTYETKFGIPFLHAYGMTETSPVALVSRLKSYQQSLSEEEMLDIRAKQGLLVPGLEMRIIGKNGEVAWDGQEMGELQIRGPWIASEYYKDERTKEAFEDGWLKTGDVAVIDGEGFVKLVDRTKDLVKSGGEWISSVDLENALMAHPAVFEASVVGIPHPKWDERPVAFVVLKEEAKGKVDKQELLDFLRGQFVKWWIPDDLVFLEEIPKTSVGKFLKRALREQYKDHLASAQR
ncbi:long-chain fatty acid--CoA ligase [Brevibacillus sp. SYP-B805]|uniref:long-chain fatty acid--CoA ligase n=1 Tax=Brevibacillus sp. SYP-B805 TaxID=1578199 RepID=UPI0013EABCB2|nr:long-chain fatty acid--CoA ligase [Brevibacillus sp. SYP-B805]NGQ93596.1 long-chain fatty acid--CoA ligase [Brevibacillus sp. SYP-B805]